MIRFLVMLAAAMAGTLLPSLASAQEQPVPDRLAVVVIDVECEDPTTGARVSPRGSGFIYEKSGLIITAYHVVSCYMTKQKKQWGVLSMRARVGSPDEEPAYKLDLLASDERADVALLRILGNPKTFKTISTCALRKPASGMKVIAAGFPEGRGFQPVDGTVGNADLEGGRWAAASDFTAGMSGGPVAHRGYVVGIIKGGVGDTAALRMITPIYKATLIAQSETGNLIPNCDFERPAALTPPPPPRASTYIRKISDTYIEGTGYIERIGMSYAQCESLCLADTKCRQFEHFRPKQGCNLFDRVNIAGASKNADVGTKVDAGQTATPINRNADLKLWNHNGSTMTLHFEGGRRKFIYHEPKPELAARGVKRGTVLFDGTRSGPTYAGKARLFRSGSCAEIPYDVVGVVSSDQRRVELRGLAPIVEGCAVVGRREDLLVFTLVE